jgi:hypothetical protein
MHQRFGLISISLLIFSAVLCVAISVDPKGFALKEWQPLIASLIALGSAAVVYNGATLAYPAAMAKVTLDEAIHETTNRRKRRGMLLRLRFSVHLLGQQARRSRALLVDPPETGSVVIAAEKLTGRFAELDDISEAWASLDDFPAEIARDLLNLKIQLDNIGLIATMTNVEIQSGEPLSRAVIRLREVFDKINEMCGRIHDYIREDQA